MMMPIGSLTTNASFPRFSAACPRHARLSTAADQVTFSGGAQKPEPLRLQSHLSVPILEPRHVGINVRSIFNPGAIEEPSGGYHLLTRVTIGPDYAQPPFVSILYHAFSPDGYTITKMEPAITPQAGFTWGFEDPRITRIGRDYYIVATGYDGKTPQICLFKTRNFKDIDFEGVIGPKGQDDKDAFFHPEKVTIDGQEKFMLFHRMSETGNIQYVLADSIDQLKDPGFWDEQLKPDAIEAHTLMKRHPGTWEDKLGGGPPPIRTKDGWLFLYHASDQHGVYRMGVALLDLNDPRKVIARAPDFVMEPEQAYELDGPVPNVVFPQGVVKAERSKRDDNPELYIYYGAADKSVGMMSVRMNTLLDYVKQFDTDGTPR